MLSIPAIIEFLNAQKGYKCPPFLNKWRGVYYGMSLHTTGACPAFRLLNNGAGYEGTGAGGTRNKQAGWIYPVGYHGRAYQTIFEIYLLNRHPREPEETFQWRLSQYRPYTRTPFQKCIEVVSGAIFQDSNFSIVIEDKDDAAYIEGRNFNGYSLIGYIMNNFSWIIEDPNGRFITIPKEPYYATATSKIESRVYFIPSKDIISLTDDEIIFNINDIAWVVNNIGYFRFKKNDITGKYIHIDESFGGYYAHEFGRMPNIIAGGIWNTQGYFDSWFNNAKAVADDFISNKSAEQLVNKEASHPFIIEASTECPDCNVSGLNSVQCPVSEESPNGIRLVRCSTCGGSHTISHNPADRMIVPPEQMKEKLIQIINPDIDINKFHKENCADIYTAMMEALHMNYVEQAQSGVAKDKDMETRYQFILNISNDLFDRVISGIITDILSLRNVAVIDGAAVPAATGFYITKPTQFQIKTASQLLEEYKVATESQLPDYVRAKHVLDYVDKQFGGDATLKRKTEIINQMDFLSVATEADKESRVLGGACSSRDWQFSVNLSQLIDGIIREKGNEWFCAAKYNDVKALVDTAFALIPPVEMVEKANTSQAKQT